MIRWVILNFMTAVMTKRGSLSCCRNDIFDNKMSMMRYIKRYTIDLKIKLVTDKKDESITNNKCHCHSVCRHIFLFQVLLHTQKNR